MAEQLVPILRVADARRAAEWYGQLGFEIEFEEQYSPEFPAYVGVAKGDLAIHLSERAGDATPDTLLYFFVADVDKLAAEMGVEVVEAGRSREIHLTDLDRNRLRIATRVDAVAHGGPVSNGVVPEREG
jgi:catechol 2,3-dioxygenase-like lactoylglutathione lyase family enzyme